MSSQGGRPTIYSNELASEICTRLAGGESLRSICRDENMPAMSTILYWAVTPGHEFLEHYLRAREAAGYAHADNVVNMADMAASGDIDPNAARAAMNGYIWAAERMAPKKHSPKQDINHTSEDGTMSPKDHTAAVLDAIKRKHETKS